MSLNHYNAFKAFENQLLRNFPDQSDAASKETKFTPTANTIEVEKAYELDLDLPGVEKESIKIDVKEQDLIISGERALKAERTKEDYFNFETKYGSFSRVFTLPKDADAKNITATSVNGVLSLSIPKLDKIENHYSIDIK